MRILLVDDETTLARQITEALNAAHFIIDHASDGEQGEFLGATETYDAAILDLGLPKMDGLSVLRSWRNQGLTLPVLILTARGSWSEKVEGLNAGADDYLAKPFQMEELIARLKALIRRATGQTNPVLQCGPLTLDTRADRISIEGVPLGLTALEYRLLSYLMHNPGRPISRMELTEHLYAQDFDRDSNTIEVFVGRLRKKLPHGLIATRRGLGYCLQPPEPPETPEAPETPDKSEAPRKGPPPKREAPA